MHTDNEIRRFLFIQTNGPLDFFELTSGWLELAEERAPLVPKAFLEGDYLAYLPDGSCFKEVSFKRAHEAVEQALPDWARQSCRLFAHIDGGQFALSDGRNFLLDEVRFVRLK